MSEQFPLTYFAQAVFAAFVAALLILMLRRPAERWRLVDVPGGRKRHATPVAVTGGRSDNGRDADCTRGIVFGIR